MHRTCTILVSLLVFSLTSCQDPATRPRLYLYDTPLSSEYLEGDFAELPPSNAYTLSNGNRDMSEDSLLIQIVRNSKALCADGVWRFYPETDFYNLPSSPHPNGYELGQGQYRYCANIPDPTAEGLASMKSFRYLGPANWVDEFSMTVYEGHFYSGNATSVVRVLEVTAMPNPVNINFDVQSFVITAPNKTLAVENQQRKWCSSWLVNIGDNPSIDICYNLCACPNEDILPKMYMENIHSGYPFYSMRFVQRDIGGDNGAGCDEVVPPAIPVTLPFC